jgi:HNH endonuclease
MPILKQCETCGKNYSVPPSRAAARFCGMACYNAGSKSPCATCGAPLSGRSTHTYCSKSCKDKASCRRRAVLATCVWCGAKHLTRKSRVGRNYCSLSCANSVYGPGEIGGRTVAGGGYTYVRLDGKMLREHRLVWETAHGPIPPGGVIHHKDGNPSNNHIDNLELISSQAEHMRLHGGIDNEAGTKVCTHCREARPFVNFARTKTGFNPHCKDCRRLTRRVGYLKPPAA